MNLICNYLRRQWHHNFNFCKLIKISFIYFATSANQPNDANLSCIGFNFIRRAVAL